MRRTEQQSRSHTQSMSSTVEAILLVLVDNLEIVVEILAILAVTYLAWNALMD